MNKTKRIIILGCVGVAIVGGILGSVIGISNKAHAVAEQPAQIKTLTKKAQYNGLKSICYGGDGGFLQTLPQYTTDDGLSNLRNLVKPSSQFIFLPGYATEVSPTAQNVRGYLGADCTELLLGVKRGSSDIKDVQGIANKTQQYNVTTLGYTPSGFNPNLRRSCFSISYKQYDANINGYLEESTSNTLCVPVKNNENNQLAIDWEEVLNGQVTTSDFSKTGPGWWIELQYSHDNGDLKIEIMAGGSSQLICSAYMGCGTTGGDTWSDMQASILEQISELENRDLSLGIKEYRDITRTIYNSTDVPDQRPMEEDELTYELDPKDIASVAALRTFTGSSDAKFDDYLFTPTDWAYLYQYYVNAMAQTDNKTALITDADSCSATKSGDYAITKDNGKTWCTLDKDKIEKVGGTFAIRKDDHSLKAGSFADVIKAMMALDYSKVDEEALKDLINGATGDDGATAGEAGTVAACYEGTGALGWIVCPVLEATGTVAQWMYNNLIKPALSIKANAFFSTDSGNGVYGAWAIFRNLANVLFAVVFVIIILAQVTGVGVSNYNIKKILPRLIIVVVLVNASYIICQLAVDVSNLLGSSIQETLTGIKINGAEQNTVGDMIGMTINGLGLATLTVGGTAAFLSSAVAIAALKELWLPILIAIIGCVIAIFFFFLLLGVRQAGVVILVVLAPVAIVCYALPNTKPFFDKWKKLFTAMLFVYPICGLLMGGGQFAGAVLLSVVSSGNPEEIGGGLIVFYTITAMLLNVVPFFLIPSILKGSMAVAGNLGAKIANFGNNMRGGISRGIRNTNSYKEHQEEAARNYGIARNQRRVDRLGTTGKTGGVYGRFRRAMGWNDNLSNRQQALLGRAQSSLDKASDERAAQLRSVMEQNGTANDITSLRREYDSATDALLRNPNDYEALERQKAAASLLLSNGKGRAELMDASQKIATRIGGMTDAQEASAAMRTMRRSINSLRRTNGGDIAKSALLDEQLKQMSNFSSSTTASQYAKINDAVTRESTKSLNTKGISEMKHQDLEKYMNAITSGNIQYGSDEFDRITSLASRAMTDQHYKGNIEAESMPLMQQLANMRYAPPAAAGASPDQVSQAISGASGEEMARIQQYLQDTKGTSDTTVQAERTQLLNNLSHTLGRSLAQSGDGNNVSSDDASFNVRSAMAQQIGDTLIQNGRNIGDVGSSYGYNSTTAQDRYDIATGMRADPSSHQTLAQLHPDWEQAQNDDIVGNSYKKGDWVRVTTNSGGVTMRTRLTPQEAQEAQKLQEQDVEWRINQQKADAAAKQRWGRP